MPVPTPAVPEDPIKKAGFGVGLKSTNPTEIATTLMDQKSPLMQQAATRGRQYANTRGLINSSVGAQAGQAAALDAVLPLASATADINANTDARNRAGAEGMVTSFHSMYQNTVANILANPDIKSSVRNKQLKAARDNLKRQTTLVENLYDIDLAWDTTIPSANSGSSSSGKSKSSSTGLAGKWRSNRGGGDGAEL